MADPISNAAVAVVNHDFSMLGMFFQADLFVKSIMLFLILLSVVTWGIMLTKVGLFRTLRAKATRFEDAFWGNKGLEDLYRNTRPEDADHPMAKLYVIGLNEWDQAKAQEDESQNIFQVGVVDRVRQLMSAKMVRELEKIENMLPLLATIGSTAPFIGLLGTVWGIMSSFQSIGMSKNTSLAVVAPGIAEALLATALGLFAAIPAVIAYNKLSTELGRYAGRMEAFVGEFTALLEKQFQEKIVTVRKSSRKK